MKTGEIWRLKPGMDWNHELSERIQLVKYLGEDRWRVESLDEKEKEYLAAMKGDFIYQHYEPEA